MRTQVKRKIPCDTGEVLIQKWQKMVLNTLWNQIKVNIGSNILACTSYLTAATMSGSLVKVSICPMEILHRSAWVPCKKYTKLLGHGVHEGKMQNQVHRRRVNQFLDRPFRKTQAIHILKWLTCGYPPWAMALMSASFSKRNIDSFSTGGVRKSVCKTIFLDDALFAYIKDKTFRTFFAMKFILDNKNKDLNITKVRRKMKRRNTYQIESFLRSTISRMCFTSSMTFLSPIPLSKSSSVLFTACARWHICEALMQ